MTTLEHPPAAGSTAATPTQLASQVVMSGRAVLYCRVSTEEQAREGQSLETQDANLRAYCTLRGLDVVEVVVDAGVSAFKPLADREGGRRVLELVGSGATAVVAWKLDRLFRNVSNCLAVVESWKKRGVELHLADLGGQAVDTSSAAGKMFLVMLAGFAEMERNLTAERIKAVLAKKRDAGEYCGGTEPYGWRKLPDGTLEPETDEQETIAIAKDTCTPRGSACGRSAHVCWSWAADRRCLPGGMRGPCRSCWLPEPSPEEGGLLRKGAGVRPFGG